MYVLYSSNINIIVLDKVVRDKVQGLLFTEELKIFKRDHLIEVPSVLLSILVIYKKSIDNLYLANTIYKVLRIISLGL
jgi:hypothetical protein